MTIKNGGNRIIRTVVAICVGGAMVFTTPIGGCQDVVKQGDAARIFQGYGYIDIDIGDDIDDDIDDGWWPILT